MAERQKLTITQVSEPVLIGDKGAEKLQFQAKGADGRELRYFTFSKRLFPFIIKDKEVEADVDVTTRTVGDTTYTDRKVTQVYVEGKAVAGKSSFAAGQQWKGRSPEEIASIEAQVAAKLVTEGWVAGKLPDDSPEVQGMLAWIRTRLPFKRDIVVKPLSKGSTTKVSASGGGVQGAEAERSGQTVEEPPRSAVERFRDECRRYGWDNTEKAGNAKIVAWLMELFHMKWGELSEEAQERAIEQMQQMADEKEQQK